MAFGDQFSIARLRPAFRTGGWRIHRHRAASVPAAGWVGFLTIVMPWLLIVLARTNATVYGRGEIAADPWSLLTPAWGAWALTGLAVAGVFALVAWARLKLPAPDLSRTAVTALVALAAFAAWCAASIWLWSPSPTGAWRWTVMAVGSLVAALLGVFAGAQQEGRRGLVLGVAVVGVLTALIGTVDLLAWPDGARRIVSPVEPSTGGLLVSLGLLAVVSLDQRSAGPDRVWLRLVGPLLLFALVASASRSAVLVTVLGVLILSVRGSTIGWPLLQSGIAALPALVTVLLAGGIVRAGESDDATRILVAALLAAGALINAWAGRRDTGAPLGLEGTMRDRQALFGIVGVCLVAGLVLAALADGGIRGTWDRTVRAVEAREVAGQPATADRLWSSAADGRLWRLQASIDAFQHDDPVLGTGPGSGEQTLRRYRRDTGSMLTTPSAAVAALSQAGAVGAGLLVVGLLGLSIAARRERRRSGQSDSAVLLTVGSVVLLHALFNDDHLQPLILFPAFACVGALVAHPSVEQQLAPEPSADRPPGSRTAATAAGVAVAVVAVIAVLTPTVAQTKARQAEVLLMRGDPASVRDAALFASQSRQLDPIAHEGLAVGSQAALAQQDFALARSLAVDAVRRAPEEAAAWRALARVALAEHDRPGAIEAARHLQRLDPASPVTLELTTAAVLAQAPPEASPTAIGTPLSPEAREAR